ncbi:hypothetical protein LZG07_01880 [Microbacterium profundi]|uniref:hypothetical protein n=1 Tax=Microbacterium profundi TaxID=450380 RepID=UPI001F369259|nr:hypothetical protein [Microbacterium profundi]MCE7480686.1 hypothetical protein [Microbacterium profundi]
MTVTTQTATAPGIGVGAGKGLIGLRERVALVGGWFDAGPSADGFVVRARIPA